MDGLTRDAMVGAVHLNFAIGSDLRRSSRLVKIHHEGSGPLPRIEARGKRK